MDRTRPTSSPLDAIASTQLATAAAACDLTVALMSNATALAASMWAVALGAASNSSEVERAEPRRERIGNRSTGSWYRPPYRSPFDPLFWLSPGHPVDHVQSWLPLVTQAPSFDTMLKGAIWWPAFAALAAPGGMPTPWWVKPAMPLGWGGDQASSWFNSVSTGANNVIDFDAAYAAYRSAGGHALAQITRESRQSPEARNPLQSDWLAPWPLMLSYALFPWQWKR